MAPFEGKHVFAHPSRLHMEEQRNFHKRLRPSVNAFETLNKRYCLTLSAPFRPPESPRHLPKKYFENRGS